MRRMWVGHGGGDAESVDQLEEQLLRDGPEGYWEWRLAVLEERASDGERVSPVYMAAAQASLMALAFAGASPSAESAALPLAISFERESSSSRIDSCQSPTILPYDFLLP